MTYSPEGQESTCFRWMDWVSSLWSDSTERPQNTLRDAPREMEICYSQPHLVPPMKLVFYDDLPSPHIRPASSHHNLASLVSEGRNLASRASSRASISMRRRRSRRPTIGAPTEFRRENPPPARLGAFRPLELSIYLPGNRLSDLPEFDDFDLPDFDVPGMPKSPPKTYARATVAGNVHRRNSSTFNIPRKPISAFSASENTFTHTTFLERRPSSAFWNQPHMLDERRRTFTDPLNSHPVRRDSEAPSVIGATGENIVKPDATSTEAKARLACRDTTDAPDESSLPAPSTPTRRSNTPTLNLPIQHPDVTQDESSLSPKTRSRTKRVTQWLMRSPTGLVHPAHRRSEDWTKASTTLPISPISTAADLRSTSPSISLTYGDDATDDNNYQTFYAQSPQSSQRRKHRPQTSGSSTVSSTAPTMASSPTMTTLTTMTNTQVYSKGHRRTPTLGSAFGADNVSVRSGETGSNGLEGFHFSPVSPLSPRLQELKQSKHSDISVVPVGTAF